MVRIFNGTYIYVFLVSFDSELLSDLYKFLSCTLISKNYFFCSLLSVIYTFSLFYFLMILILWCCEKIIGKWILKGTSTKCTKITKFSRFIVVFFSYFVISYFVLVPLYYFSLYFILYWYFYLFCCSKYCNLYWCCFVIVCSWFNNFENLEMCIDTNYFFMFSVVIVWFVQLSVWVMEFIWLICCIAGLVPRSICIWLSSILL